MSSRYRRLIKVSVLVSPIFSVNHLQQSGGAINFCSASHHSVDNEISNRRIWTNDFIIRVTFRYPTISQVSSGSASHLADGILSVIHSTFDEIQGIEELHVQQNGNIDNGSSSLHNLKSTCMRPVEDFFSSLQNLLLYLPGRGSFFFFFPLPCSYISF
ncbi:uncharacterized protein LOC110649856 isoform X1 [Hevea brasiliensis]|uniref:uncharacterized protein LOC110649856 isoform X1 n=1 Tax=Hevea brasiliensis TaxID=3981 RepID=UPI0025D310DB|nr:uncharacterized protein LOC110649856 isoform X1 [Hevea brasiliensis]